MLKSCPVYFTRVFNCLYDRDYRGGSNTIIGSDEDKTIMRHAMKKKEDLWHSWKSKTNLVPATNSCTKSQITPTYAVKEVMKRILLVAMMLVGLLPDLCLAQHKDPAENMMTRGWLNGQYWLTLDKANKTNFLMGVEAGTAVVYGLLVGDNTIYRKAGKEIEGLLRKNVLGTAGIIFGEVAQQVDVFYDDNTNIQIPISCAYWIITLKTSGASPIEIESQMAELRRTWNPSSR